MTTLVRDALLRLDQMRKDSDAFDGGYPDRDTAMMDHCILAEAYLHLMKHLARGFMTCDSCGPENDYRITIKFRTLEEAQEMHRRLLAIDTEFRERTVGDE